MRLSETNIDEELKRRLQIAINELTRRGLASGVRWNDGMRIEVFSNNYVEIILRYINKPLDLGYYAKVEHTLFGCGLIIESNVSREWNKKEDRPGRRWEEAFEVGLDQDPPVLDEVDDELTAGVYCVDVRPGSYRG